MDSRDVVQQGNMAEAAVESPAARFFCHKCSLEISPVLPVSFTVIKGSMNNLTNMKCLDICIICVCLLC